MNAAGRSRPGSRPNKDPISMKYISRFCKTTLATTLYTFRKTFCRGSACHAVFQQVYDSLSVQWNFFRKKEALRNVVINPLQRISASLRLMSYCVAADSVYDYLRLSETSALKSLKTFALDFIQTFVEEYLRAPDATYMKHSLCINSSRGFPGMAGSIYFQHCEWKSFPTWLYGQYEGKEYNLTIFLEGTADIYRCLWFICYYLPGSLNYLNKLYRVHYDGKYIERPFPPADSLNNYWYHADATLPSHRWHLLSHALFVKIFSIGGTSQKHPSYSAAQEAVIKDVERAFGVLVSRINILERPFGLRNEVTLGKVVQAYVILHNMFVEYRHENYESGTADLQTLEDNDVRSVYVSRTSFATE